MAEESKGRDEDLRTAKGRDLAGALDAAGWGLFFIWVGIAFLADVGVGVGLLGVGIITLGGQAVRKFVGLKLDGFWMVVGLLFALGGIWSLLDVKLPLIPALIIVAGSVLLLSAIRAAVRTSR